MAGADINVKIALDGEKDYRNALKNCNDSLKNADSALKAFDESAKGNAKSLENMQKRQELLSKALDEAKKKQETLKDVVDKAKAARDAAAEALTKAKEKEGENSKAVADAEKKYIAANNAVDRWETQLNKANEEVAKYTNEIDGATDETADFQEVVGKTAAMEAMTKIAEKLSGAFKKINSAISEASKEIETGLKQINKRTGASGETLEKYQKIARNTFTSLPVSIEAASDAVGELATRFGDLNDQDLASLTESFVKFADINGTDVAGAIDSTQKALAAFGLTAEDAETVLDVFNKTGQNTGANAGQLASKLVENAEAFQQMGLDIYQATDFLGKLEVAGADSNTVLSGMKRALKSATEEGKPFNEALEDMQEAILNGTDDMDGLTVAYDLFGKSGASIYTAVKNGNIDFKNLASSTDILNSAQNNLNDTYDSALTVYDKFEIAQNNIEDASAELRKEFNQALTPAIEGLTGVLKGATEKFKDLPDSVKTAISVVATLGGKVLEVAPQIASLAAQIAALKVAKKAAGDTTSLKTSLGNLAGKAGLVTGIITAIATGVAYMSSEMEKAVGASKDVQAAIQSLKGEYKDTHAEVEGLDAALEKATTTEEKIAVVQDLLTEAQRANAEATSSNAQATEALNNADEVQLSMGAKLMGGMAGLNAEYLAQVEAAMYAANGVKESGEVMDASSGDVEILTQVLSELEAQLYADGKAGGQMTNEMAAGMRSGSGNVYSAAAEVGRQAQAGVNSVDIAGNGYNIGANLAFGIVKGINYNADAAVNAAATMANRTISKVRNIMAIASPSKVFEEIGKFLDLGLAKGIDSYAKIPVDTMADTMKDVIPTPNISRYDTGSSINNQVAVYIGDKELTAIMAAGVVKNITTNQRARYATVGA